jgi:hypothetical protein
MSGVLKSNYPSLSRRELLMTAVGTRRAILLGPALVNAVNDAVKSAR